MGGCVLCVGAVDTCGICKNGWIVSADKKKCTVMQISVLVLGKHPFGLCACVPVCLCDCVTVGLYDGGGCMC